MSARDVTHQSDIGQMKLEADGSFKRKDSNFRDQIAKGGKFEPEKGVYDLWFYFPCMMLTNIIRPLFSLRLICLP